MAYLLCQEPGPAIGREYGMWYVRTLGSRED